MGRCKKIDFWSPDSTFCHIIIFNIDSTVSCFSKKERILSPKNKICFTTHFLTSKWWSSIPVSAKEIDRKKQLPSPIIVFLSFGIPINILSDLYTGYDVEFTTSFIMGHLFICQLKSTGLNVYISAMKI